MDSPDNQITQHIKKAIHEKNPDAEVILFGSHARGDWNENSDWDVLVLLDQEKVDRQMEREYQDALFDLELQIGEPITVYVFTKNDWELKHSVTPFYQNIAKEGILL